MNQYNHGDTLSTATSVALPSETAGVIDSGDDADWFRFEVAASGEVAAYTTGNLDTVGALYDADGNRLAGDFDSGAGFNFRIQRQLDAGIYYAEVKSFANNTGSYALRLGDPPPPPPPPTAGDHGDSILDATSVALPSETAGVIDPGTDVDWFRFEVAAAGEVTAESTGGLDVDGVLHDYDDNHLADDFDSSQGQNFRIQRRLDAGAYHLRVRSSGNATGSYTLRLSLEEDEQLARQWPHLRSLGDFNGDGKDDVLLRHDDGRWYFYPMNGRTSMAGRGTVPRMTADLAWQVTGIGDFDGDGRDDVLLRHADGRWYFYPLNGRAVRPGSGEGRLISDTTRTVAGIGDMNGDGRADILIRRDDGGWHYYPMNGRNRIVGEGPVGLAADAAWTLAVPTPAETVDGLRIAADARSAQPLQAVTLTLRGAAANADYDILMDLSGARGFADDDTIEVAPVKTAAGQLLFAAPLPETLAEGNAARRIAVRVRERAGDADATLSNTLMLALGETDVPDEFAGHPTVMMDVVLKAVYEGLDDPLLTVEAAAIEPGRSVRSARTLGLSTAYSDA